VDDLARELGLTDNAIRSHLIGLERDGLVRQGELRRGGSKPSFTYELTEEAERLFPKAYGVLLTGLLGVLAERLPPEELANVLREVGHRIPTGNGAPQGELRDRVEKAVGLLAGLGGLADIEETERGYVIRGCSCPLAAAVKGTPDACLLAETLLSDVIGVPVQQVCDQGPPARCCFEVPAAG
jgi:predicted ArsR family transcriptional regulator